MCKDAKISRSVAEEMIARSVRIKNKEIKDVLLNGDNSCNIHEKYKGVVFEYRIIDNDKIEVITAMNDKELEEKLQEQIQKSKDILTGNKNGGTLSIGNGQSNGSFSSKGLWTNNSPSLGSPSCGVNSGGLIGNLSNYSTFTHSLGEVEVTDGTELEVGKTTLPKYECFTHGNIENNAILVAFADKANSKRYCGKCYEEMLDKFCRVATEVK